MLEFRGTMQHLPSLLDAAALRQRTISHNLANVNTPGYRRLDVKFEESLAEVMHSPSAAKSVRAEITEDNSGTARADGNNVDIDKELGELNKNAMLAQFYSQLIQTQFETMRRAIEAP